MIALDPNNTFSFSLDVEARCAARRIFVCRFPTARQLAAIDQLTDRAAAEGDARALYLEAIRTVLVETPWQPLAGPRVFCLDIDAAKDFPPLFTAADLTPEAAAKIGDLVAGASGMGIAKATEMLSEAVTLCVGQVHGIENATAGELEEIVAKTLALSRLSTAGSGGGSIEELQAEDLWQVILKIFGLSRLTENDRKKSALRSAAAAMRRSAMAAGGAPA